MKKLLLTVFYSIFSFAGFAQGLMLDQTENDEPTTTKTEPAQESNKALNFSGYVDTYYYYNFNGVKSNLGASGFERVFDHDANSIEIGLAQLKTTYETKKVTGVIDLVFGNNADLGNYGNKFSPLGGFGDVGSTAMAIKQAYFSWNINEMFTLTAGQYGTHIGYEVIDAPLNYHYSLSNLFGNGPFYQTGIKLETKFNDKVSLMFGLNDGLDSKGDFNNGKGLCGQLGLTPIEDLAIYVNYYRTNESLDDNKKDIYSWFDITSTYSLPGGLNLGLNAAYGMKNDLDWGGVALFANKYLTQKFALGARYEYFNNSKAGIYLVNSEGAGVVVNSLTITGKFDISPNLMFKPEYRFDSYNPGEGLYQLYDKNGNLTLNKQSVLGGAFIFYFN